MQGRISRVAVAGATGYLGSHLVEECARRGLEVTALVRGGKQVPAASKVVEVDVTDPATLVGIFDEQDAVFSALGITRQTDKVTYEDIEYTANKHLLAEAQRAGVGRFGVIAVVRPEVFHGLAICDSRERFIAHMQEADISTCVVRATGFFSDMTEVFEMAASGRIYLIGDGSSRVNPVHGADLAAACLDAMQTDVTEVNVGGPDVLDWEQIATCAFDVLGTPKKVTRVPSWVPRAALPVVRLFNRRAYDVGSFISRGAVHDVVAPPHGHHTLTAYFQELARARLA